jgi:ribosome maturation factor RimP
MPSGSRHPSGPRPARSARAGSAGSGGKGKRTSDGKPTSDSRAADNKAEEARIADAIQPVVTAAGMDLESVRVSAAGRRRLLRVVVDSDRGVSLDDAATVSREVSAALDKLDVLADFPYTLEVSSPGVDRPLTAPAHWRRAAGRLVKVKPADGEAVTGRVVSADSAEVILEVDGARRRFAYTALGAGAIQIEFGRLPDVSEEPLDEASDEPEDPEPDDPELGAIRDGH